MEGCSFRAMCKAAKLRPLSDMTGETDVMPFKVTPEGLRLELLDHAHIAYSRVALDKSYFDEFHSDGDYAFAVDANVFKRAIRGIEDPEQTPVVLMYNEAENKVFVESYDDHLHTRRIATSPVEHEAPALSIPETPYPACIEMSGKQLGNVLRDLGSNENTTITFSVTSKALNIRSTQDATNHEHIFETTSRSRNGKVSIVLEGVTQVMQEFSAQVLRRTIKPLEFCDPMRVRLREHLPMQLEAALSADGMSYMIAFIAPTTSTA